MMSLRLLLVVCSGREVTKTGRIVPSSDETNVEMSQQFGMQITSQQMSKTLVFLV